MDVVITFSPFLFRPQAQANERRLKAEEEALKHASDMLERHNGALAERIVRNEQITHELQRRAKRARQLQKVTPQRAAARSPPRSPPQRGTRVHSTSSSLVPLRCAGWKICLFRLFCLYCLFCGASGGRRCCWWTVCAARAR